MKVFVLPPGENWICDRFVQEWYQYNSDISTSDPNEADIIWLLADWCWNQIPIHFLRKRVVVSVHHITPDKFGPSQIAEFLERDRYADLYHVPCEKTAEQIRHLTHKPILVQPFWVNQQIWHENKLAGKALRESLSIDPGIKLIGSFQRDTEGHDLKSPKLEKGPDIFCDVVEELVKHSNVEVLLGGWRRQYVMNRLKTAGIKYHYLELPDFQTLNAMYNALDLYIVGARWEGGPQAIVECACTKTPIISTDVGVASLILPDENIFDEKDISLLLTNPVPNVEKPFESVQRLWIPRGFEWFRNMLQEM